MHVLAPVPFGTAVDRLRGKTPVATSLGSAEWAGTRLELRERSIWSAHVNSTRAISAIQSKIGEALDVYAAPGRSTMDRSKFVAEMRQIMREEGLDTGGKGLTNPASRRRLELIYDFQTQDAMSYGRWKSDQDPDALDAYPAQEFLRVESRRAPRSDWPERWKAAGGRTFGGRMIALKSDPVWMGLSRFGRPWPPFDYESGMGIEDVSREDAEELGLLKPGERVAPAEVAQDFNQALEESVKALDEEERRWLELSSGGQVKVEGDTAKLESAAPQSTWKDEGLPSAKTWTPEAAPAIADRDKAEESMREGLAIRDAEGAPLVFDQRTIAHWQGKGPDASARLTFLPWAIRTAQAPIERWDQGKQVLYLSAFRSSSGVFRAVAVYAMPDGSVITYFLRDKNAVDRLRKGLSVRQYIKNPPPGGAPNDGTIQG